jgi:hypothetical protein
MAGCIFDSKTWARKMAWQKHSYALSILKWQHLFFADSSLAYNSIIWGSSYCRLIQKLHSSACEASLSSVILVSQDSSLQIYMEVLHSIFKWKPYWAVSKTNLIDAPQLGSVVQHAETQIYQLAIVYDWSYDSFYSLIDVLASLRHTNNEPNCKSLLCNKSFLYVFAIRPDYQSMSILFTCMILLVQCWPQFLASL